MSDTPRPAATINDTDFSLTIEEVAERYANAGHPRTLRTLQRYCASGHLDCRKAATTLGDKYFVTSQSVARHIAQTAELAAIQLVPPGRDASRPGALGRPVVLAQEIERLDAASGDMSVGNSEENGRPAPGVAQRPEFGLGADLLRQPPTGDANVSPLVAQREKEIGRLHDDIAFLRNQISTKDEQIAALLERDKETNFLVRGLQQMLTPLLAGPLSSHRHSESPET